MDISILDQLPNTQIIPSNIRSNAWVHYIKPKALLVLSLKLLRPVISLLSYALSTGLRITERIEYKLLRLTYKVLTTTQPPYLHNLISVQRPRSTHFIRRYSCSATFIILSKNNWLFLPLCFTLSLEPTSFISSSTFFWYQFLHLRLTYSFTHHFYLFNSPLCSSITPSLFHFRLKT